MDHKNHFIGYVLLLTLFLAVTSLSGCGSGGKGGNDPGDTSSEGIPDTSPQQDDVVSKKTWVKTFGGIGWDWAASIQQTSDGGYILAASTDSSDNNGDILIVKLARTGDVLWQKSYGGEGWEWVANIQQTSDDGYILAGSTDSSDSDGDIWVVKLDKIGDVSWHKSYGDEGAEFPSSIQITSDGGYVLTGSESDAIDGHTDTLVMKLGENGGVVWEKIYTGNGSEWSSSIQQTRDGGYVVAGSSSDPLDGTSDTWVISLDEYGEIRWRKSYAGEGSEWPSYILQTSDDGFIMTGYQSDHSGGNGDLWVMKLDSNGVISWQRAYGGDGWDSASSVYQTSDGGYVVAGSTSDLSADYGDALVIKISDNGDVEWQKRFGGKGLEEAYSIQQTIDGGYIVAGSTDSFGAGNEDILVLKLDANGNTDGCMSGTDSCAGGPGDGKITYTLTVNKGNNGVVISDPPGINCGYEDDGFGGLIWRPDCTHVYDEGTVVTLTPVTSTGSLFSDWTGDEDCSDGQVTMEADNSCTATFGALDFLQGASN